jgi:hypothetical protein
MLPLKVIVPNALAEMETTAAAAQAAILAEWIVNRIDFLPEARDNRFDRGGLALQPPGAR